MEYDAEMVAFGALTMLRGMGLDPDSEDLRDTPARVARAWAEQLSGYQKTAYDLFGTAFDSASYEGMIVLSDVHFSSTCEHHLLPFVGKAQVGYIPSEGKVCGLSKLARLVDIHAKRLQLQERMTQDILSDLVANLKPLGAGVILKASHQCMSCRGVQKQGAEMVTASLHGVFKEDGTARAEFMGYRL